MTAPREGGEVSILGATRAEGQRLMRQWYAELDDAARTGRPTANVFVMGSMAEILRTLDILPSFPEVHSLQTAVRHRSMEYLNKAEDYGYSPDICGYVKADVGVHLSDMEHPLARLPRPQLVVASNMCNTYIKWAEIWERMDDAPVFTIDLPGMRSYGYATGPGDARFEADKQYVLQQLQELIAAGERITGKKFDMDRLAEVLANVDRMRRAYIEILELNKNIPAPFNVMSDGLTIMGIANIYRGTEEGARYMELVAREMRYRVEHGIGHLPEERHRLVFVGTFCYVAFRRFIEMIENWKAVFVHSEYLTFASGGLDMPGEFDLNHPLESLAEQIALTAQRRMSKTFFSHDEMAQVARDWRADAVLYHAVKSCRTVSTVLADSRENMMRNHGIPALLLESDLVDARVWSEAQIKNRVDAFFEALETRRAVAGGAAGR